MIWARQSIQEIYEKLQTDSTVGLAQREAELRLFQSVVDAWGGKRLP